MESFLNKEDSNPGCTRSSSIIHEEAEFSLVLMLYEFFLIRDEMNRKKLKLCSISISFLRHAHHRILITRRMHKKNGIFVDLF
jgi:hypothetical protein